MVQAMSTKAILQPAKEATMCTACQNYSHPPPLIPPYSQILVSKLIVLTDNMWPKSDNAYMDRQWLNH